MVSEATFSRLNSKNFLMRLLVNLTTPNITATALHVQMCCIQSTINDSCLKSPDSLYLGPVPGLVCTGLELCLQKHRHNERFPCPASLWPTYLSESAERRMTELRLPNRIHDTLEYGNHCMHLEPGQCIGNAKWYDPGIQETKYKVAAWCDSSS